MKIIVDECLPQKFCKALVGHSAILVQKAGYSGFKDGKLLDTIEGEYEVFITIDGNLTYQQNLAGRQLNIIILVAPSNTFGDVSSLVPEILSVLARIKPGEIIKLGGYK